MPDSAGNAFEAIKPCISVVIPVYGCRAAIPELHRRLVSTLESMGVTFEIIMVNDACPQGSWEEIVKVCDADHRVVGINLSRNFGQIRAITAGLDASHGDWVVVMDCDLQDRPEGIPALYEKALEGYDCVFARRVNRKDSGITKFLSRSFYKVYDYFTDGYYDSSIANFGISRRIVIDNYCRMRESHRAFTLFIKWLGFRQTAIDLEGDERFEGTSSYNLRRKIHMASEFITAQSNKPLHFSIAVGMLMSLVAFLYVVYLVVHYFVGGDAPTGWTTVVASEWLIGGLLLMSIGIVGVYIGNIFDEVRGRPLYVVKDVRNGEGEA